MVRFGVIACMAFLVSPLNPSVAQPATERLPGPPPPAALTAAAPPAAMASVYAAKTVAAFLAICGNDQGGCADEVGVALNDKMVMDGSANICLPGPDYAGPVLSWLKAHPETHDIPTEDGLYLALRTVYSCG